jgi:hypothetical protein
MKNHRRCLHCHTVSPREKILRILQMSFTILCFITNIYNYYEARGHVCPGTAAEHFLTSVPAAICVGQRGATMAALPEKVPRPGRVGTSLLPRTCQLPSESSERGGLRKFESPQHGKHQRRQIVVLMWGREIPHIERGDIHVHFHRDCLFQLNE